jgi:hypothetical protein
MNVVLQACIVHSTCSFLSSSSSSSHVLVQSVQMGTRCSALHTNQQAPTHHCLVCRAAAVVLLSPNKQHQQAPACKGALQCLGQVLAAVEPGAWPAASVSFQLLLSFVTDVRPKIRKRACSSVTDVLAAAQTCPTNLAAASEAVLACEAWEDGGGLLCAVLFAVLLAVV